MVKNRSSTRGREDQKVLRGAARENYIKVFETYLDRLADDPKWATLSTLSSHQWLDSARPVSLDEKLYERRIECRGLHEGMFRAIPRH